MQQQEILAFPAHLSCPVCKRVSTVSGVLTRDKIHILVYECECGAITVLGDAPNALPGSLRVSDTGENKPLLLLQQSAAKIATPPGYVKKIEGNLQ